MGFHTDTFSRDASNELDWFCYPLHWVSCQIWYLRVRNCDHPAYVKNLFIEERTIFLHIGRIHPFSLLSAAHSQGQRTTEGFVPHCPMRIWPLFSTNNDQPLMTSAQSQPILVHENRTASLWWPHRSRVCAAVKGCGLDQYVLVERAPTCAVWRTRSLSPWQPIDFCCKDLAAVRVELTVTTTVTTCWSVAKWSILVMATWSDIDPVLIGYWSHVEWLVKSI